MEKIEDPVRDFPKILSNLHYTHFFLMDKYNKILSGYGLSAPQSNVLGIISHFHPNPVSLQDVKKMVLEPNSDVSRIVSRLVEKEYVVKVANTANRRKVDIALSAKGLKTFNKLIQDRELRNFTAFLSLREAQAFTKILTKLRNG